MSGSLNKRFSSNYHNNNINIMKKDDLIIFIIGLLLLAGMLFTIFFGGEKSLHGVGTLLDTRPKQEKSFIKVTSLDLGQSQVRALIV
jgi:hypothetical protein